MRVVAIIQARLTSTRFPRKVLEKIGGKSMIARVCEAARDAQLVDKVVVAWAHKFPHLDENDVLGRYREVAEREKARFIVRVTSDCPLLNGEVIDQAVGEFLRLGNAYYSNRFYMEDGYDVQVFSTSALYAPWLCHKEHVIRPFDGKYSVDTPEDLARIKAICETK